MSTDLSSTAELFLWIGFFAMFGSFLTFYGMLRSTAPGKRMFHAYTCGIVGFAATAYLFMAFGYGYTIVDGRVFHYARYLDWLVTTPLLLLDLGALAGISNEDALMLVILDILMILAGLAGGLTTGAASFWLWILGCTFFLPIIYDLAVTFRAKAKELGEAASSCYEKLFILTLVLWTAYPVVFFFAEYANTLPTTYEIGTYMVLDVTAKCVFGFILLTSRDGLEQATTGYAPVNGISV